MKIFKKKQNPNNSSRESNINQPNQRVYTYYTASKSQIDSFERSNKARLNTNNKNLLGSRLVAILAVLIGAGLLLLNLTLSSSASIKLLPNSNFNQPEAYSQQISAILKNNFANNFKPTLKSQQIEQGVLDKFPEAVKVEVYAPLLGRSPTVKITTSEPFATLVQPNSPAYIIDVTGRAVVDLNNTAVDTKTLPTINNQSNVAFKLGDQVFKAEEITGLLDIEYQLKQKSNSRGSYVITDIPREARLLRGGYFVKFNLDTSSGADTNQQFGALISVEESIKEQGGQSPAEYIDVRLGDKVYIK